MNTTPAFPQAVPVEAAPWSAEAREAFHHLFRRARHFEALHVSGGNARNLAGLVEAALVEGEPGRTLPGLVGVLGKPRPVGYYGHRRSLD